MKAMVFAAGLGTRLRPLTDDRPKALVEVGGVAMLGRVMTNLVKAGVTEAVVNVHHFAPMVRDYLMANGNFGITVHVSDESGLLLDTGGGILKAREWLDGTEPFIVHNADILTDMDLRAMYDRHSESGADATLLVASRKTSRYLLMDRDSLGLRGWINIATGETRPSGFVYEADRYAMMAFGGVHVISPSVFPALVAYPADNGVFSITPFYLWACDRLDIRGYMPAQQCRWFDIGKPDTLRQAEAAMSDNG